MVETPRRLALRSQSALRQLTGMGCVSRHPAAKNSILYFIIQTQNNQLQTGAFRLLSAEVDPFSIRIASLDL